jgi:hypothetical protein
LIYLVDPYGNIETGHFWKVTTDFCNAISSLNLDFKLLTPTPKSEIKDLKILASSHCLEVVKIPTNLDQRNEFFENFIKLLNQKLDKTVVIFTWLPSNTHNFYENLFSRIVNANISIFGISTLTSSSVMNYDENYSFELQDIFEKYANCKVLWVWHEPNKIRGNGSKLRRLPEFHSNLKKFKFSNVSDNKLNLNFFGGLNSFRGFGEILLIALFNPDLIINIKGYGYSKYKIWRPMKNKLFRYSRWQQKPLIAALIALTSLTISFLRYLPNVKFDPTSFKSEEEFLQAISFSQFIFIGCKLPHSSGVALASLSAGVPVIWFGEKGEAVRILRKSSPMGQIKYRDIFVYGRITKLLKGSNQFNPKTVFSWEMMLDEIRHIKNYL